MPEAAPPSPKREGLGPTFRHLDDPDVPWQAVKAQRNADGSVARVWEKWLAFSPDPQYLTLYARYDPGMVVRRAPTSSSRSARPSAPSSPAPRGQCCSR
jgi:hypothetical protein